MGILHGMKVLLVEDESFSRRLVAGMLLDLGRPNLFRANNGAEALVLLGETKIDLIISDFNMPHVHGLQLLRAVRNGTIEIDRAMPFAMLTGYSEKRLVDMALALDANAFLIKPVSKDGLEKRLSKMLTQVKSANWLKDKSIYSALDVDRILDDIIYPDGKGAPSTDSEPALLPKDQPLFMSGPVEVRGHAKKGKKKKTAFNEDDLRQFRNPKSGRIEVRDGGDPYGRSVDEGTARDDMIGASGNENGADGLSPNLGNPQIEPQDAKNLGLREYLCPVDEVPNHAHLTRDIYTANGRLFIHAGTRLTPLIISILGDLSHMDHPADNIWIEMEDD